MDVTHTLAFAMHYCLVNAYFDFSISAFILTLNMCL